jgi:predicted O-methyltransferase YrrM
MSYYDFNNITTPDILEYADAHCSTGIEQMLDSIEKQTALNTVNPRMVSGKIVCNLLRTICKIQHPKKLLEIGVLTGYSAIATADAIDEDAVLTAIEINPEYEKFINENIAKAGLQKKINLVIGDAKELIPTLGNLDFVYIDADKISYSLYFDLLFDKMNTNGIIIADNVLWSGKILEKSNDKDVVALQNFNKKINEDIRVDNVLLPLRDGLMIIRKKQ